MAKTQKRSTGDLGEGIVCQYLEGKGYSIVERNYWRPWGEIDIVAKKEGKLHFVEVKSVAREPGVAGIRPEENMHRNKILRLYRAVQTYLAQHRQSVDSDWQIDLACVYIRLQAKSAKVDLIENISL
jgi:putative endonuclease